MSKRYMVMPKDDHNMPPVFKGDDVAVVEWLKQQTDVSKYDVRLPNGEHTSIDQFLRQHIIPEFYTQLVPRFYRMDPKTDDLIPNGKGLTDGMKVLVEDPDERAVIKDDMEDWELDRALVKNRWCEISHLSIRNSGRSVSFVAVYEDGSKRKRQYGVGEGWLVKKDSITASMDRAAKVQDLVQEAMTTAVKVVNGEASDEDKADQLTNTIHETTAAILGAV